MKYLFLIFPFILSASEVCDLDGMLRLMTNSEEEYEIVRNSLNKGKRKQEREILADKLTPQTWELVEEICTNPNLDEVDEVEEMLRRARVTTIKNVSNIIKRNEEVITAARQRTSNAS